LIIRLTNEPIDVEMAKNKISQMPVSTTTTTPAATCNDVYNPREREIYIHMYIHYQFIEPNL